MKKKKNKKSPAVKPGNPADHGYDHNVSKGTENDLKSTPVQKQESSSGRGIDNEDSAS